jgi:hypothetical protein
MVEALDPGLMNPASTAERRLQQQLEVGVAGTEGCQTLLQRLYSIMSCVLRCTVLCMLFCEACCFEFKAVQQPKQLSPHKH